MFLDFGVGILSSILVSKLFFIPLTASFVLTGILFSVLVDIDFIIYMIRGDGFNKNTHGHRNIFHYPILYLLLGALVTIIFFRVEWLILFTITSLSHFVHDSIGIGWGIKWFWPISKKSYKFFSNQNGRFSKKPVVSWDSDELTKTVAQYGDPHWFKNLYLRPSPVFILELLVFVFSLAVLFYIK